MTIGRVQARRWPNDEAARLVVLVHGYGEHIGRYEHVAQALAARGSAVVGPDHVGHGRSAGERALVEDFEPVVMVKPALKGQASSRSGPILR